MPPCCLRPGVTGGAGAGALVWAPAVVVSDPGAAPALTLVAWRWFCEHCSCWAGFPSFTETSIFAFPPPWETSGVTLTNGLPGTLPLNSRTCRLYNSARAVPRPSPVPTPIHHMGQRGKELKVIVVGVGRGCVCVCF